jgi:hypothetical protein
MEVSRHTRVVGMSSCRAMRQERMSKLSPPYRQRDAKAWLAGAPVTCPALHDARRRASAESDMFWPEPFDREAADAACKDNWCGLAGESAADSTEGALRTHVLLTACTQRARHARSLTARPTPAALRLQGHHHTAAVGRNAGTQRGLVRGLSGCRSPDTPRTPPHRPGPALPATSQLHASQRASPCPGFCRSA